MILITGGAGFVGSNFILQWLAEEKVGIVNLDKLTSSGNLSNLSSIEYHPSYHFIKGDIRNKSLLRECFLAHRPKAVVHSATELPGDKTQGFTDQYLQKHILATKDLLDETLLYWEEMDSDLKQSFRFLNISSSEVYGVATTGANFANEQTPYSPIKPNAILRAAVDDLVHTYHTQHGLPTLTTYCSNNFGPFQFPTKLIPLIVLNALQGNELDVCEEGNNVTPWLYVGEHCNALRYILANGSPGESYHIGAQSLMTNIELIDHLCQLLDELKSDSPFRPHKTLIKIEKDNPKYGQNHILDDTKLRNLGWTPKENFHTSLKKTILWYLHNMPWVKNVMSGEYKDRIYTEKIQTKLYVFDTV